MRLIEFGLSFLGPEGGDEGGKRGKKNPAAGFYSGYHIHQEAFQERKFYHRFGRAVALGG